MILVGKNESIYKCITSQHTFGLIFGYITSINVPSIFHTKKPTDITIINRLEKLSVQSYSFFCITAWTRLRSACFKTTRLTGSLSHKSFDTNRKSDVKIANSFPKLLPSVSNKGSF